MSRSFVDAKAKMDGGIAQAGGCDTAQDVGKRSKERYTADYVFYTAK